MPTKTILVTERIHDQGMILIENSAELKLPAGLSEENLIDAVADVEGIIIRSAPITESIIKAAKNLKVIGVHGIGVDYVDIAAATKHGIPVVNVPHANTISVAEHAVGVMLSLTKGFRRAETAFREGVFDRKVPLGVSVTELGYTGSDLYGKTVGLVGFGNTAQKLANVCIHGFSMNVIAHDPHIPSAAMESAGVEPVSDLESVFRSSDYVSIHVPLVPQTVNLITSQHLELMKPGAILVNTARGGIVNEADLYKVLKEKQIAGAAIDVFESEPPLISHPLFQLENILLTPHIAGLTDDALVRMAEDVATGVLAVLDEERPRYCVNPEVFA